MDVEGFLQQEGCVTGGQMSGRRAEKPGDVTQVASSSSTTTL